MKQPPYNIALWVKDLCVQRGNAIVADGISFHLQGGQALSLRGANGTGKTSIIRSLAGFASPYSGELHWQLDGQAIEQEDVSAHQIHFLGHESGLAGRLTVTENLNFWRACLGGHGPNNEELISRIGLTHHEHYRAHQLSAGQKRRLGLARLILCERGVWLLDEPDAALDKQAADLLGVLCQQHLARNGIIITAAHAGFTPPGADILQLKAEGND
ncbi:MAG: heme ABC exporter ATP-binding protein CcmA [bacterium]